MTTYHTIHSGSLGPEGLFWIERADAPTFDGEFRFHHIDEKGKYTSVPASREELGKWVAEQAAQLKDLYERP